MTDYPKGVVSPPDDLVERARYVNALVQKREDARRRADSLQREVDELRADRDRLLAANDEKWQRIAAHEAEIAHLNSLVTDLQYDIALLEGDRPEHDGVELIADERQRQIDAEGWTPEHDDEHREGQLVLAADCYLREYGHGPGELPPRWPWDWRWWKPSPDDRVRELVKAGALIAAEIDRLQRLKETT